jgi:flagellin
MRINQNISALNAWKNLTATDVRMSKSLERLSSGSRINRAADDAAGLAISEKMRAQLRGLGQAQRNAEDAISLLQTAEGAMNETHGILQRVRELAVQAASDTLTNSDRSEIQKEMDQLVAEVDRIATTTEFNTKKLLNGSAGVATSTSDATKFGSIEATGETGSGTISFSAATVATVAGVASTTTYANATTATGAANTITFNGESFSVASGATVQAVIDAVNTKKNVTNVEAYFDANALKLRTLSSGSAAYIDVTAAGGVGSAFAGIATGKTSGANATVTTAESGFASTASGNTVTVTAGAYKGLKFDVKAAVGSATTITVGANNSLTMHVGANADQNVSVAINSMTASMIGVNSLSVATKTNANNALATIDTAITTVSSERAKIGAIQNRLEHTIANLGAASENMTAAESRIRDVDMAQEMAAFTRAQILMQAGTAMMAQANQKPQSVLQLLK